MSITGSSIGEGARGERPQRWRRPTRRRAVEAGLVLLASAAILLPDIVGLDRWTPFAQAVALRPVLVAGGLVAGTLALFSRRLRLVGAALGLVALAGTTMVVPRALNDVDRPDRAAGSRTLTILSANVAGSADVAQLARTIHTDYPDIVVLVEAGARYRERLQTALTERGYRGISRQSLPTSVAAMTLLVSAELDNVRFGARAGTTFPTLTVTGAGLDGVRVVAFHSSPPLPPATARWRSDLSQLARWCGHQPRRRPPTIVAGDFNATVQHSPLQAATPSCSDTAAALGNGLYGTWPSRYPPWLTPQIDHILTTAQIDPIQLSFRQLSGTDHRAVLARVQVPGDGARVPRAE